MAQNYGPLVTAIQDKIRDLVTARATADAVTIEEVLSGLHGDRKRYASTGVYVLLPRYKRTHFNSQRELGRHTFTVECNMRNLTEASQLTRLGQIVSVVVDAIDANPTLAGVSSQAAEAWVDEVSDPKPGLGVTSLNSLCVRQTVPVNVNVARTKS